MASRLLRSLAVVGLLATVTLAHGGRGGHGGPKGPHRDHHGPAFLKNVSREGRKEFEAVVRNETMTIAEQESALAALAEKYNVSAAYTEFETARVAKLAAIKTNQTQVIANLETVVPQLAAIYKNKNQTRKAQEQAVSELRKQYRVEVAAVKFIRAELGAEPNGGRFEAPRGGPGGPRGGPGGRGGRGGHRGFY